MEFAIVGVSLLLLILGIVEFGRVIFTLNMLEEGSRRAARVAAVCSLNAPQITAAARFVNLPGSPPNVAVEYLNAAGGVIADLVTDYGLIRSVRVRIFGYQMGLAIPFVNLTFNAPQFAATLPRESLGVPRFGAIPACS